MRDTKIWHNVAGLEKAGNSAIESQKHFTVLSVWIC